MGTCTEAALGRGLLPVDSARVQNLKATLAVLIGHERGPKPEGCMRSVSSWRKGALKLSRTRGD